MKKILILFCILFLTSCTTIRETNINSYAVGYGNPEFSMMEITDMQNGLQSMFGLSSTIRVLEILGTQAFYCGSEEWCQEKVAEGCELIRNCRGGNDYVFCKGESLTEIYDFCDFGEEDMEEDVSSDDCRISGYTVCRETSSKYGTAITNVKFAFIDSYEKKEYVLGKWEKIYYLDMYNIFYICTGKKVSYYYSGENNDWKNCNENGCPVGTPISLEDIFSITHESLLEQPRGIDDNITRLYFQCWNKQSSGDYWSWAWTGYAIFLPPADDIINCLEENQCEQNERCIDKRCVKPSVLCWDGSYAFSEAKCPIEYPKIENITEEIPEEELKEEIPEEFKEKIIEEDKIAQWINENPILALIILFIIVFIIITIFKRRN